MEVLPRVAKMKLPDYVEIWSKSLWKLGRKERKKGRNLKAEKVMLSILA
jgi:hypothetical protein